MVKGYALGCARKGVDSCTRKRDSVLHVAVTEMCVRVY